VRVVKVGGSVLQGAGDYVRYAELSLKLGARVIVVSAMRGVTDSLLKAASAGDDRALGEVLDRMVGVARELGARGFEAWVERCLKGFELFVSERSPRYLDEVLATGERVSACTMAAAFEHLGLRAVALDGGEAGIVTDDRFGEARPLFDLCFERVGRRLGALLAESDVVVVGGFVGATLDGRTTTMGRGASDLTATIVARALRAETLYLVTDSPHLMTADPDLVPTARPLESVGLGEADAMAELRVKRFHPLTFKPLLPSRCTVVVGSTPPRGTRVVQGYPPPDLKVVAQQGGELVFVGRGARRLAHTVARELGSRVSRVGDLYFAVEAAEGVTLAEAHDVLVKLWTP